MKSHPFLSAALSLCLLSATAFGDASSVRNDAPPVIDIDSIEPAAGWNLNRYIRVTGRVTDDCGLDKVEYRIVGKGKWKKASLRRDRVGENDDDPDNDTDEVSLLGGEFTFKIKASRSKYTRVMIRAKDSRNQESDYIVRRFRYDRYRQHQPFDETPQQ